MLEDAARIKGYAKMIREYCRKTNCANCVFQVRARYFDYCGFEGDTEPEGWDFLNENRKDN